MFPTTRNLQIHVHVNIFLAIVVETDIVPMIAGHDLVKKSFGPMIADHDLVKKR
jgi:hypothetical protein